MARYAIGLLEGHWEDSEGKREGEPYILAYWIDLEAVVSKLAAARAVAPPVWSILEVDKLGFSDLTDDERTDDEREKAQREDWHSWFN